ncbi:hypothetical protein ACJMK2_010958 [Sinanodonta woodiana]|uniref:Fucosyltransferase n=1 Tax=Sinanodonta woodiana TaxID=1069815 RepID=A0ABD3V3G2_SINWO
METMYARFKSFSIVLSCKTRKLKCLMFSIVIAITVLTWLYVSTTTEISLDYVRLHPSTGYIKYFTTSNSYKNNTPKILFWTPFFGSMVWYRESMDCIRLCPWKCELTDNKDEITTSDALLFHLTDITWVGFVNNPRQHMLFKFPGYRRADQIWIAYNLEPLSMLWGNFHALYSCIDWTWSYRRDADVYNPYGFFRQTTEKEKQEMTKHLESSNYFREKNKTGLIINSNCNDDARRYKLVHELGKYLDIDWYGGCGLKCPDDYRSCDVLNTQYKLYFAFENAHCRDYISEKFWRRHIYHQIPVVAWKIDYNGLVPPNSFINVFDFPDLNAAGKYIAHVAKNETLFNSYFDWMKDYTADGGYCGLCRVCRELHTNNRSAQVYEDFNGWLTDDSCKPASIIRFAQRSIDRLIFDGKTGIFNTKFLET